ncbi:MAG: AraC family transcriptional regulator [Acetobacteraceae bacterium]|nr:AraC family transcriptional regulator [Acetobacteraceae bacterium]
MFKRETGLTFSIWQRRACLLSAIPRRLDGERVTTIAYDRGYASPAAFTTMFRQLMGTSPDRYRGMTVRAAEDRGGCRGGLSNGPAMDPARPISRGKACARLCYTGG